MGEPVFLRAMQKGHQGETLADSKFCIFHTPLEGEVLDFHITYQSGLFSIEFTFGWGDQAGAVRLSQVDSNLLLEETGSGLFGEYLAQQPIEHLPHAILYAIRFKSRDLTDLINHKVRELKDLEDDLDNRIDNFCTYKILDFRREFADYGNQIINAQEFLRRCNKGYYPNIMQSVLAGEVELEFQFVEERYDLVKDMLIKDMDTYTSIVNNNINRNTRLLSVISLMAVALNLIFAGVLSAYPWVGVVCGAAIAVITVLGMLVYRWGRRRPETNPKSPGDLRKARD